MKFIRKPIKEDESLLLVDIDDNAMNSMPYSWPWPRYIHGDALEVLADFGAKAVVYDVEFLGESIPGINREVINTIKDNIKNDYESIYDDFINWTTRIANDPSYKSRLSTVWENYNTRLTTSLISTSKSIDKIITDNDLYFAKRLRYYGKAYGTVNMLFDKDLKKDDIKEADRAKNINYLQKYGMDFKQFGSKYYPVIKKENVAEFPADVILKEFKGVGFTKVERDKDASIRFIDLLMEKDGYVIPQLALKPFLDIYNITSDKIDISNPNFLILKNVKLNNKDINIKIPLVKGRMYIDWPKGDFSDIFTNKNILIEGKYYHLSYRSLFVYRQLMNDFINELTGILSNFNNTQVSKMIEDYNNFLMAKNSLIEDDVLSDDIRKEMNIVFDELLKNTIQFCIEENINKLVDKELSRSFSNNSMYNSPKNDIVEIKKRLTGSLKKLGDDAAYLKELRIKFDKSINNKICFIGLTATGTTDMGSTPFDKTFENVGTHPTIFNMLLQNKFIHILPLWMAVIISFIFFGSALWFLMKHNAVILISCGSIITVAILIIIALVYRFTNYYLTPVVPVFFGIVSFIVLILFKFILTEKDKFFIKNAFDKYLSPEVIKQLLKDPSRLVLGGERKNCTAVFTDIEGFSEISEKFMDDPPSLVNLLNRYLSAMSDIILENQGTIDKYEGDAIIAFFGAPMSMSDHPLRACISAVNMRKIENQLNNEFIDNRIINKPLHTRIGINTGDMFVGNMGTTKKFNYTMMGHAVNLASRLEGVNKLYGTYSLISEYTYEFVKNEIVCRRLDRVRVVNIKTPIRLYELICLKSELTNELKDKIDCFDRALTEFEKRNWNEAVKLFNDSKFNESWDKAVDLYLDRLRKFIENPPQLGWDGVYNMSVK